MASFLSVLSGYSSTSLFFDQSMAAVAYSNAVLADSVSPAGFWAYYNIVTLTYLSIC